MTIENTTPAAIEQNHLERLPPDYAQAVTLHREILANAQLAADAFVEFCKGLKRMRDSRLYTALGYETFEDYTVRAAGLKQRQAYNYISTYERLGESFLQSNANLGITKLELLASVPAIQRDDVAEANDLEGMSVQQVRELTEKYNAVVEQLSMFQQAEQAAKDAQRDEDKGLLGKIRELEEELADARGTQNADQTLTAELERLKEQLKETELDLAETQKLLEQTADADTTGEPDEQTLTKLRAEAEQQAKAKLLEEKRKLREDADKKIRAAEEQAKREIANAEQRAQDIARQQIEDSLRDLEQEKADALARAVELEKKVKVAANPETVKLNAALEIIQEQYAKAYDCITRIAAADTEAAEKFRSAIRQILSGLAEQL